MTEATISSLPVRPSGALTALRALLGRHYRALGAASRRLRFLTRADDAHVSAIAGHASPDEVLTLGVDNDVHGVLEIFETGDGHAEISLSVEDAYQGRGYGRLLFRRGLAAARARGLQSADLYFSAENAGVRRLVVEQGARLDRQGGDCLARIAL